MKNYSITKLKKSFLPIRAMIFMTTLSFALTTSITQAQETADVDITTYADIIPDGIGVGGKFRLLILTQLASPLSTFNDFATTNARAAFIVNQPSSQTDIRSFSSQFKALVSSSVTDARDNTGTKTGTHTDAPIYWLLGDKVADDYADFYDGSWDSRNRRNEQGTNNPNVGVITGSTSAGIVSTGNGVDSSGSRRQGTVHGAAGNELDNGTNYTSNFGNVRFLILSPVFTVTGTTTPTITISEVSGGYVNDAEDESDITISGVSTLIDDAQTITLTISDTDGTTADVTKTPTVTSNDWSTTLTSANIKGLAEGTITITAAYTGAPNATQTFLYDKTAPTLVKPIADQTVIVNTSFELLIIPGQIFSDVVSGQDTLSSTGQANGIVFDGIDRWSGTPTVVETQTITITVTDRAGNSATYNFNISVVAAASDTNTAPTIESFTLATNSAVSRDQTITVTDNEDADTLTAEWFPGSSCDDSVRALSVAIGDITTITLSTGANSGGRTGTITYSGSSLNGFSLCVAVSDGVNNIVYQASDNLISGLIDSYPPVITAFTLDTDAATTRTQDIAISDADTDDTVTAHWGYVSSIATCDSTNFPSSPTEITLTGSNSALTGTITYSGETNNGSFICVRAGDGTTNEYQASTAAVANLTDNFAPTISALVLTTETNVYFKTNTLTFTNQENDEELTAAWFPSGAGNCDAATYNTVTNAGNENLIELSGTMANNSAGREGTITYFPPDIGNNRFICVGASDGTSVVTQRSTTQTSGLIANATPFIVFAPNTVNTTPTRSFDLTINVTDGDTAQVLTAEYRIAGSGDTCDADFLSSNTTAITNFIHVGGVATNGRTATITFNAEADNGKKICVKAMDNAGVPSGIAALKESPVVAAIDRTPPGKPTVALINNTGTSNSDTITNDADLRITSLETGASLGYSLDSGTTWIDNSIVPVIAGASVDASGFLTEGSISIIFRQTDPAGNVSASSDALEFTYDTTGPILTTSLDCSGCQNNVASVGDSIIYTFTSPEDIAQTGIQILRQDLTTAYTISSITARGFVATYVVTASSPNTTDSSFTYGSLTDIAGNSAFPGTLPTDQQVTIDTNPFITTWNTEAGDPGSTTIKLPISGGAYDVDTNNDGTFDLTNQAGTSTITINFGTGNAGIYTIAVRPNPTNNTSNQLQINHYQTGGTPQKLTRIDKWGDIVWTSMETAFHSCSNMTIANDAGVPNLTMVTNTHGMFAEATNFTGDLSGWDVSNVANVSVMFAEATSFNSDLSSWNISSATNMRDMLRGATSFTTQNYNALLRGWSRLPSLQSDVAFGAPPTNYCDQGVAARDVLTNPPNNWNITGDSACTPAPDTTPIENTENYFISTWEAEQGGENNFVQIPITGGNYDIDADGDGSFDSASNLDIKNANGLTLVNLGSLGSDRRRTIRIRLSPTDNNPSTQLRINHSLVGATPERLISIQKWGGIVWSSMENAFKDCTRVTIADDAGVPDLSMVTNMDAMFSGATSLTGDLSSWDVSGVTSMTNMFTNASSFTTQDYDALLIGWSSLPSLQNEVTFGAPPTNYCAGEAGRNTLTGAIADGGYNWTITGDTGKSCSDLLLSVDAFLQGPYTSSSMMSDGLREGTHIPTISPYGDENTIESERTVLDVEGTDAIVDWVEISLHNRNNIGMVISTTPALLQRDGDVVGLNGTADLVISGAVGNYYVSVNHRNHIPVITAAAKSLSTTNTAIDFTNDLTIVTGGSNAMAEVEVKSDNSKVYALFSGDVNGNGQIQVDDYNAAIQDVGRGGYLTSDVDMNGELQVSDINFVLKTLGKGAQF